MRSSRDKSPLGPALLVGLGISALLGVACVSGDVESTPSGAPCATDADCQPMGLVCRQPEGQCGLPAGAAGGGGMGVGGGTASGGQGGGVSGSGAAATTGGSNGASGGVPGGGVGPTGGQGGVPSTGGTSAAGGQSPTGGSGGGIGGGEGGTASKTGLGGSSGKASGGTSGMGGAGGTGGSTGGTATGGTINPPGTCDTNWDGFPSYNGNGSLTTYSFNMGTGEDVHCSFGIKGRDPDVVNHVYTNDGRYFAAINTQDYRNGAACGACVEVNGPRGQAVVTIVDECPVGSNPVCQAGHLDLSLAAFQQVTGDSTGVFNNVSWHYVACPVPDNQNVTMRLKEPDNQYYTAVVVQDTLYPIESVQIKGQNAQRTMDNFWLVGDGNQAPAPWSVRAVDVNGWIYEASLNLNQGGDISTNTQADCN